jgi:hypothetical protein
MAKSKEIKIIDTRHPMVYVGQTDWSLWRKTYDGGLDFRDTYLKQFTAREEQTDFNLRREITPIPTFAKAALNDIRNAIFQRMRDILRRGGSETYQNAINGLQGGIDRRGSTMNAFLGMKVLTELLVMGRVGVYVDAPVTSKVSTLAEAATQPYLYQYTVEDILNWKMAGPDKESQFQAILLRDTTLQFDQRTLLPSTTGERYRLMWIDSETGNAMLQFYSMTGDPIDSDGELAVDGPVMLELKQIPFVILELEDSLLKDVCYYQIALLNLVSADVNYALRANFTFMVEQRDLRATGAHLKRTATAEGTATAGGQGADDEDIKVGATHGRAYDKGMNAPAFINPSSETLEASLALQVKLENDIRKLINLAVTNIGENTANAPIDNAGLEAGLSYIGLILENAERQIATHWAAYEQRNLKQRNVATVKYPDRYSLKTDGDRVQEAGNLSDLMTAVPGRTVKKELGKLIVTALLAGKVDLETIQKIEKEIEAAGYTTSNPTTIIESKNAGLVGDQTASEALGFTKEEYLKARADHIDRIKRIAETQGVVEGGQNPAARGVDDLAPDTSGGRDEKKASRETDLEATTTPRVRGEGRATKKGE